MLNKVMLIGRVGKDPESRYTTGGNAIASFSLATSEKWKDKAGEKQEKTEWMNVVCFSRLAEIANEYVKKGDLIYVEGKMSTEKWTDKEGKDRYTVKIIANEFKLLGSKSASDIGTNLEKTPQATTHTSSERETRTKSKAESFDNFDADIPF